MHVPILAIEPVAIALDRIETTGDIRFSGVDLETGARVTVTILTASSEHPVSDGSTQDASGLVLVLSMETLKPRQ